MFFALNIIICVYNFGLLLLFIVNCATISFSRHLRPRETHYKLGTLNIGYRFKISYITDYITVNPLSLNTVTVTVAALHLLGTLLI